MFHRMLEKQGLPLEKPSLIERWTVMKRFVLCTTITGRYLMAER